MGTDLGDFKLTEYDSLQAAKKEFTKTYLDKTGNKWDDRDRSPGTLLAMPVLLDRLVPDS